MDGEVRRSCPLLGVVVGRRVLEALPVSSPLFTRTILEVGLSAVRGSRPGSPPVHAPTTTGDVRSELSGGSGGTDGSSHYSNRGTLSLHANCRLYRVRLEETFARGAPSLLSLT